MKVVDVARAEGNHKLYTKDTQDFVEVAARTHRIAQRELDLFFVGSDHENRAQVPFRRASAVRSASDLGC
jgi:hypothetical protein